MALAPRRVFTELAADDSPVGVGDVLSRPLGMAALLGAFLSFVNTGRLGLSPLVGTALCWSFAPALRLVGLAAALLVFRIRPTPRLLHLYGAAQGPWQAWILAASFVYALSALETPDLWSGLPDAVASSLVLPLAWSLRTRFAYATVVLQLDRLRSLGFLAVAGGLFWLGIASWFLGTEQLQPRVLGWFR